MKLLIYCLLLIVSFHVKVSAAQQSSSVNPFALTEQVAPQDTLDYSAEKVWEVVEARLLRLGYTKEEMQRLATIDKNYKPRPDHPYINILVQHPDNSKRIDVYIQYDVQQHKIRELQDFRGNDG